ncbi:MAG: Omp28 family outer membrane lipoprotein [Dysgonamonadaceae bacterium]|jgi:hypothetical protein|nr:Omp28 family outer membrane lipoprotein [Dysgonamonadaceae bacterium]
MKKNSAFFLLSVMFIYSGCDTIPENNRQIDLETNKGTVVKKVLLLDFTDQACPNCPEAGAEVAMLKEIYGDTLVAVTIHSSPRVPKLSLVTEEGNVYNDHFGAMQHPAGVIDGKFSQVYEQWAGVVLEQFKNSPSLDISLSAGYNSDSREINVITQLKGLQEISNAKLLLWIIEDNVINKQLVGSTVNNNYLHRHIFRSAINGVWGELVALATDEKTEKTTNYILNENWKPENISIVGFVYNVDSDKVLGVTEIHLLNNH